MSQLWAKTAEIDGSEHGLIGEWENLRVDWPWLDSRTGEITVPLDSPHAARLARPIETLVKVYYGDVASDPVLTGHVVRPRIDYEAGTIVVPLHDPTIKLKRNYHRFGDIVVDVGYPLDGRGMRRLVASSIPSPRALADGCQPNGIQWGQDLTTRQGPKDDPQSIWNRCQRGENVWDSLLKAAQKANGPDFDFRPDDDLPPGYFVRLRTGAKLDVPEAGDPLSEDHSAKVKFIWGINADGFLVEPDGDAIRNFYVAVAPGGERSRANADKYRATASSFASWQRYGVMQGWESVGEAVPNESERLALLRADAQQWVDSYAFPPTYFQITPRQDAPNVPKLLRDFVVGDVIGAAGRRVIDTGDGRRVIEHDVTGRVMRATLAQAAAGSGQSRLTVECAPVVDAQTQIGGE